MVEVTLTLQSKTKIEVINPKGKWSSRPGAIHKWKITSNLARKSKLYKVLNAKMSLSVSTQGVPKKISKEALFQDMVIFLECLRRC